MKTKLKYAAAGMAAFLAASTAMAGEYSGDVIKVGVLTDMASGYSDFTGSGSVTAARLAIEDFGGMINGTKIEMVTGDHQFKADISALIARKWFQDEGMDVIVDLPGSSTAEAAKEVGRELHGITMITGAGSSRLSNESCSPYSVHWMYDTYSNAFGIVPSMVEKGFDKWFLITVDYSFGHALSDDFTAALKKAGGSVVGEVRHPFGTADFSSFMLQAQASGANFVGLANTGGDVINAIKSMKELGLFDAGIGAAIAVGDPLNYKVLGLETAQGITSIMGGYNDLNDETRAFAKRFEAAEGTPPLGTHMGTYTATLHYLEAVKSVDTDDSDAVMAAMRANPINNIYWKNGSVREDGRAVHELFVLEGKTPAESTGDWDLLKLISVIPGDQAFRPLSESSCPLVMK